MSLNSTDTKQIRKFGLIAFIFFGGLCGLGIWMDNPLPTYLFGTLSAFGLGFILFPLQLQPVFAAWLKIAHLIGRIVTSMILTLAYYLVITPAALIKRTFGSPPLPIKPDEKVSSYWVTRKDGLQSKEQFLKRF